MAPIFLTLGEVLAIHADIIRKYGGSLGVRDLGLLESALGMPQASFSGHYLHDGIAAMAAAYCFHLVANHPFIDGNKRVGAAAANVFLEMNGWSLEANQDRYTDMVLSIAASGAEKRDATLFFARFAIQRQR